MDFLQLEYFCTASQIGSITKAAESLHISQPSLSQTISKLEGDLQTTLFTRLPRGIVLTESGKRFLDYAHRTLQQKKEIMQQLRDMEQLTAGEIVVKTYAVSYVIAKLFCDFKLKYPDVTIRFAPRESDRTIPHKDLFRTVDLFVTTESAIPYGASSVVLASEALMLAVHAGHRLSARESVELEELAGEDFILIQESELRRLTEGYCRIAGFQPRVMLECTNTNSLFSLVATGMGVGVFPQSWKNMFSDNVVLIPLTKPECQRTIRLIWGSEQYLSNAARAFRDYIINNIAEQIAENFC